MGAAYLPLPCGVSCLCGQEQSNRDWPVTQFSDRFPDGPDGAALLRSVGRQLLTNDLIFDFGSWAYTWMTANPVWQANGARLLEQLAALEPLAAPWVLDLGAGPGNSALAMGQRFPQARLIAFDLAPQMVARAASQRAQAGWSAERLALLQGDALQLPLADATVDIVTGHSFLYLLPDYAGVLHEVHRVLRPGGRVAFLEPHVGPVNWQWLGRQQSPQLWTSLTLWRVYSWLHRRFAAAGLMAALAAAGFQAIETEVTLGGFGLFARGSKG